MITAWVTNHGVEDDKMAPSFFLAGNWKIGFGPTFHGVSDDKKLTFDVGDSQIDVNEKYTNTTNSETTYELTIARPTGRYLERWHSTDGWGQEDYGRCITYVPPTDETQNRKERRVEH